MWIDLSGLFPTLGPLRRRMVVLHRQPQSPMITLK